MGFFEVWVDESFPAGRVEWLPNGGVVLSVPDWVQLLVQIRGADSEIEPHLRATHPDW